MFTGIIEQTAKITAVSKKEEGVRLSIASTWNDIKLGESIAVDGVCLTVVDFQVNGEFSVEVSPETLRVTNATEYQPGSKVHLERALALGDRLGGHMVTGHVDGTVNVQTISNHGEFLEVHFGNIPSEFAKYIIPKGSVCISGVSLTVNHVFESSFSVMLIPHTLLVTNLGQLKIGQKLNIEYDWMAKTVLNHASVYLSTQMRSTGPC